MLTIKKHRLNIALSQKDVFEIIEKYTESKNMVKAAKKIRNVYSNIAIHQECEEKFRGCVPIQGAWSELSD